MQPTLTQLIIWAHHAGEILRDGYEQEHTVKHKGRTDLVTEIDHVSEAFLLEQIRTNYPQDAIVAEETGRQAGTSQRVWYVDPLDGTVNYAHGVPMFSVSIAVFKDGQPYLGVVYDPMRDETFSAERGCGATLNGRRLQCTQVAELVDGLLVTGFPYDMTQAKNNLTNYQSLALLSQGVRRLGSAALDLCYVAAGRLDGYWEAHLSPWDAAASWLIAMESGVLVTHMDGSPYGWHGTNDLLASNPVLHAKILAVLRA